MRHMSLTRQQTQKRVQRTLGLNTVPVAVLLDSEGGDMLQPMAAAIGGLLMEILAALFLMPCLYVSISRNSNV